MDYGPYQTMANISVSHHEKVYHGYMYLIHTTTKMTLYLWDENGLAEHPALV
jgi:hypothetical protein